ncbi:hypothetical protein AB0D34_25705 [Streptomyces sp. NPDC048420]|uniref:hypothetical protein n=1 Tax=Streptomyces sp. NPDC048420 TaxID=3155755 RepID=UPI003435BFB0
MAETASGAPAEAGEREATKARRGVWRRRGCTAARQPCWAARSKVRAALADPRPSADRGLPADAAATFEALGAERRLRALTGGAQHVGRR